MKVKNIFAPQNWNNLSIMKQLLLTVCLFVTVIVNAQKLHMEFGSSGNLSVIVNNSTSSLGNHGSGRYNVVGNFILENKGSKILN